MLGCLGLNIYYTVPIGFGIKIYHPFCIVINTKARLGKIVKSDRELSLAIRAMTHNHYLLLGILVQGLSLLKALIVDL